MCVLKLCLLLCLLGLTARAQEQTFDVKANYIKTEHRIVMRDGAKLFTVVYAPRDMSRKYPIMLNRTPYSVGPYGDDKYKTAIGPSQLFAEDGFIFVYQDVRGRFMSEGQFMDVRPINTKRSGPADIDESTDTYDTIDWLVKNVPNNNGRVGMWGISYPGFYVSEGLVGAHPALVAASPQAPIADWFIGDDFHHNGAFWLPHAFNFYANFGRPRPQPTTEWPPSFVHGTPDGYKFFLEMGPLSNADRKYFKGDVAFWNEVMRHPNYDEWWQARNALQYLRNIGPNPAVMTVGGWFDAEDLFGALNTYKTIEKTNPRARNTLVMGPWYHGGWSRAPGNLLGDIRFGSNTSEFYRSEIELPFFNCALKDKCDRNQPEAYVFETGSNRWRKYDTWPPRNTRETALYLQPDGKLSFSPPSNASTKEFDEYISDPDQPVPYINGIAIGMTREYMVGDQRFASRRPDVLTYQTDVLTSDMTVSGPIPVSIYVSTSGTDSDYIVKVIDVYPDDAPDNEPTPAGVRMGGYQMMVRGEPFRARFRNSFTRPEAMQPNRVTRIDFTMPDINHTFLKGHRIMIQIQSTWFPLVDRNPQKFVNIYEATESDFQRATERVYHSPKWSSAVKLFVIK
ncbi:MAG: CocE/NonD family hydrolase [Pyrinomonadaceae bacterium]|nr:CocE/NonD family hydrolase [Pyrinomonadaceae bacterium]